jgi:TRAP-type C4-dicarboxylate transport system permease small subunit
MSEVPSPTERQVSKLEGATISERFSLVLPADRHLKWRALDPLEHALMVLCGLAITGFTLSVAADIVTRTLGYPWLWLQEVTMTFFIYGVFIGTAAATRRNDHLYLAVLAESFTGAKRLVFETFNRLVVLAVAICMSYFGYLNFLDGFKSLRMPSMTPVASLYAAIPICGVLVAVFTIEQLVNGWRHGFAEPASHADEAHESLGSYSL